MDFSMWLINKMDSKKKRNKVFMNMETKVCKKCLIEKEDIDFHKGRNECKLCRKEYDKLRYLENVDENRKKSREKYLKSPEYIKQWVENNRDKVNMISKKWRDNNNEKHIKSVLNSRNKNIERYNQYMVNKRNTDPIFKISFNVRNRLNKFLKIYNITKKNKTFDIVGCTPEFLKGYLESQFKNGMSWENRSEWHIDHIIPLSSAKTEEELYSLCHYTNLQPLWAKDNMKKSNKIINELTQ